MCRCNGKSEIMTSHQHILESLALLHEAHNQICRTRITIENVRAAKRSADQAANHLLQVEQQMLGIPEPKKGD